MPIELNPSSGSEPNPEAFIALAHGHTVMVSLKDLIAVLVASGQLGGPGSATLSGLSDVTSYDLATNNTYLAAGKALATAAIPAAQKAAANGVASLDGAGHVPVAQISLASTNLTDSAKLERMVGIFATAGDLQAAFPAAANTGYKALVGSAAPYANYSSDGVSWNPPASGAVSSVAGKTGAVSLAVEDLSNGAALNTTIANKFPLPTQNYNAATNTPAITQGSPLVVSGNRVLSVLCTVASTSSSGPFSTCNVGDILTDNGAGTWARFPAPPVTTLPICGDGQGGERAGVPGADYFQPWQITATVPVSSRPTGITVGTNGALTTAPFAAVYGPTGNVPGVWVWFGLHDLTATSAAGYYWCVFTSTTTGTAYQETYTPGVNSGANTSSNHSWLPPASPTPIVGSGAGTPLAADNTRRSFFALPMDGAGSNLPVGYMGPDGWAEAEVLATYPSSTNNKGVSTSLSGTAAGAAQQIGINASTATTSFTLFNEKGKVSNRHSQASQIAAQQSSTGAEVWFGNSAPTKATVNTAAAVYFTLDGFSTSEYIVVERAYLRVSPN
jgi:hypothetical protein